MNIQDILTLIQAVDEHALTELKLDDGDMKVTLKRDSIMTNGTLQMPVTAAVSVGSDRVKAGALESAEPTSVIDSDKIIHSPLVGIFYNASSPDTEPFVKIGDAVKKGQILGIIEAMKLMNEIECECDGIVEAILAENESVVEYGQPLFRIR
ncbi:MAG: acetyl-CoA carboxylase biotin carboxyl carrier protein [Hungatella sp.]